MNGNTGIIATLLAGVTLLCGCLYEPRQYATKNYVVVETTEADTLDTLAVKYLNDPRKAWVISEFNKISELKPGQNVIIPLNPFDLGGLRPDGFQLVPVLAYDRLGSSGIPPDNPVSLSFDQQMDYLKNHNYYVIGLSRLIEFLEYSAQIPEKSVVITLNDNTRAVMDVALPVLRKNGFPATLFVDPEIIGKEGSLTVDDLKTLNDAGMVIQCRGGWDIDAAIETRQISIEQYFDLIRTELVQAKTFLEDVTGAPCVYYALPPAGGNNLLIELLKRSGFKAALAVSGDPNPFYSDRFHIGRTSVSAVCPPDEFGHKLTVFKNMDLN